MSEHIPTGQATEVNDAAAISIAMKTAKKPKAPSEPVPMEAARHVPLSQISFGANTRETSGLDAASIKELADSIAERGVMQPITVRRVLHGFEVVAGTRRLIASTKAGLTTIPAVIVDADEAESLVLNIIENVQRENLNLRETANAVRQMLAVFGKPADVARKLGKSKAWVSKHMALTSPSFDPFVKALMDEGHCNDADMLYTLNHIARHTNGRGVADKLIAAVQDGKVGRGQVREALEALRSASDEIEDAGDDNGEEGTPDDVAEPDGPATITFKLSASQARQFEELGGAAWLRRQLKKITKVTG